MGAISFADAQDTNQEAISAKRELLSRIYLMNKKKPLTAEEQALFAQAVKNVKPLAAGDKQFIAKNTAKKPRLKKPQLLHKPLPDMPEYPLISLDELAPADWVGIEDRISFHHSGLQDKLLKKLAQGQIQIEARLDLHRLTLTVALAEAEAFLHRCQQQGRRFVLIIHGKGKKSDKPILKNALNIWLRTQTNVLAFHSCQPKDGGTGAVYVLIKR